MPHCMSLPPFYNLENNTFSKSVLFRFVLLFCFVECSQRGNGTCLGDSCERLRTLNTCQMFMHSVHCEMKTLLCYLQKKELNINFYQQKMA